MRNLLSQQDKKILNREYKLRITAVSVAFIFFTTLIASALLAPSYIISDYRQNAMRTRSEIIKKSIASRERSASNSILNETKAKLKSLEKDAERASLVETFETIANRKIEGIKIKGLFYERKAGEGGGEITITGRSSKREPLLRFRKDLENEEIFSSAILPISNLAPDSDIEFSIKVTGNF